MKPLLEIKNLRACFETKERIVRAINGVDLALNAGETLGIIG